MNTRGPQPIDSGPLHAMTRMTREPTELQGELGRFVLKTSAFVALITAAHSIQLLALPFTITIIATSLLCAGYLYAVRATLHGFTEALANQGGKGLAMIAGGMCVILLISLWV